MQKSYRFKCRNDKCGHEFHRYFPLEEFEKTQYTTGFGCFDCGYPKMAVIKSSKRVKDGFQPGWQPNIRKHCETYSEYKAHLKQMGLIEFGYEEIEKYHCQNLAKQKPVWDDETLKIVYDKGIKVTDNEAYALKKGII